MKIAILGTGKVAHGLGASWLKAGHEVILGARDASATDPDFAVIGLREALTVGDVVVNAITGAAALAAITALDTSALAGKTLLDATNAVTATGDLVYPNSSLAEHLQAALPAVPVVKSLNTAAIEVQADPGRLAFHGGNADQEECNRDDRTAVDRGGFRRPGSTAAQRCRRAAAGPPSLIMSEDKAPPEFMSALVTEHFATAAGHSCSPWPAW